MELAHSQTLLLLCFAQEKGVKLTTQPGLVSCPAAKSPTAPTGRLFYCLSFPIGYDMAVLYLALNLHSEQNKIK